MNKEILAFIKDYENSLDGHPWFGRSIYEILDEVAPKKATTRPGNSEHSMIEILYHMNTWAEFTLKRLQKDKINDLAAFEKLDWRVINPRVHSWKKGLAEFKAIHKKIIALLKKKDDSILEEKVDYRKYNYRYLLKGLMEHNVYHLGQIAYLGKLLK